MKLEKISFACFTCHWWDPVWKKDWYCPRRERERMLRGGGGGGARMARRWGATREGWGHCGVARWGVACRHAVHRGRDLGVAAGAAIGSRGQDTRDLSPRSAARPAEHT